MQYARKIFCATLIPLIVASCGAKEKKQMNDPIIVMETTQGIVEIQLMLSIAPKACENIIKLAEKGYYNGVPFHRIIPGFMIQGGDPEGTGRGGQSVWGRPFEDEFSKDVTFNQPGILAMANAGPRSNGSQFFITTARTEWLNGHHTIFGKVISGYDVVQKIEAQGSQSGNPKSPQKIIKMYVKPS